MKTIYIMCPAQSGSGGPELLHQLSDKLINYNFKVYFYYYGPNLDNPTYPDFKNYKINIASSIPDSENNIIICPETSPRLLLKYKKCIKVIWWLSVDNYYAKIKLSKKSIILDKLHLYFNPKSTKYLHFVQSRYAREHVKSLGVSSNRIYDLSDYLNKDFINIGLRNNKEKENIILYNPKKGLEYTRLLSKQDYQHKYQWIPLMNFTRSEMIEMLCKAKLYIDFGNHPGKDRIPREAVICKCCIITNKKGSAYYNDDVDIADEYKFDTDTTSLSTIMNKINDIMSNYNQHYNNFESYRIKIANEEEIFNKQILSIFNQLCK